MEREGNRWRYADASRRSACTAGGAIARAARWLEGDETEWIASQDFGMGIMGKEALTITDQRTKASYEVPIRDGTIRAMDLRQIKTGPEDFGLMTYDPAFMNTASCRSAITFIDGDKGILRYRGYPIEQLAEKCSFLEVAYLILFGELPTEPQLKEWVAEITHHTMLHETTKRFLEGFRYDAHPMGMLASTVAALSTVYPDARHVLDPKSRALQIRRLIGKMPTIAAYTYRHSLGLPYVYPDNELTYTENFMNMLWKMVEPEYQANPTLARALDILFILHADHEENCSANAMRAVGSSQADPFLATAAACAALSGPLHGGANEEVLKMLDVIGSKDKVPACIEKVKAGELKLMGFGHRAVRYPAHGGLAGAMAGDARRSGAEDRAAAAGVHGPRGTGVCASGETERNPGPGG